MEERRELTFKIFRDGIISAVLFWALFCLFCPIVHPDDLSTEEYKEYETIATSYFDTGSYECEDNIVVTKNTQKSINVVDSNRPLSPSLTFNFGKDEVKVKSGINLYFLKLVLPSLGVSVIIFMALSVLRWIVLTVIRYPYQEEGC